MRKYYSEEILKNTPFRQDYVDGISQYLEKEKLKADDTRNNYISPDDYKRNPERYRNDLVKLLGYPLTEKCETPVLKEKKFVAKDGNVNIYRMVFEFFSYLKFYGLFFEQTDNKKNKPFIIGLHGGAGTPELVSSIHSESGNYNHLVRRLTDKGANVFAPQLLLWYKEWYGNDYDRVQTDGKFRQLGGSVTAFELYLIEGCISYFTEKEEMNSERIGVAGLSYGGMYAIHLAAVDTRIKACYSCSWVNDIFANSWADWSYPNAQKRFTAAETAALIAPRVLVVAMGDKDDLFDSKVTEKICEEIKKYYQVFGKKDEFKCVIFDGGHETDKSDEEIDFLLRRLL